MIGFIAQSAPGLRSHFSDVWKNNLLFASPSIRRPTADLNIIWPIFQFIYFTLPDLIFQLLLQKIAYFDMAVRFVFRGF